MEKKNDIESPTHEIPDREELIDQYIDRWERMSRFDSVSALENVKGKIRRINRFRLIYNRWQKIAAILIFPVLALSLPQFIRLFQEGRVTWHETSTMYGILSKITLPDSSIVELNSLSKLKYPSHFTNGKRIVELEGEGFFKVKSDKEHPFIVKCNGISVQAVGTAFNVLTKGNGEVVTSLKEGTVNILEDTPNGNKPLLTLAPGQTAVYSSHPSGIKEIIASDIDKYLAWRTGELIFRSDKFPEILETLGRKFNVKFEISPSANLSGVFTGTFVNKDLETILKYISTTTPVKFSPQSERMDESRVIRVE